MQDGTQHRQQACGAPPGLRRGVVAVVFQQGRFLVIRRSQNVTAPGAYCFPGGEIEADESEPSALCRELLEELSARAQPIRRLWQSVTERRVHLAWWLTTLEPSAKLIPNPTEVQSVHWLAPDVLYELPGLLESNRAFLAAWTRGEIRFGQP